MESRKYSIDQWRAKRMLNEKKPQHPPTVFYIKRTPHLLEKYSKKEELEKVIDDSKPV